MYKTILILLLSLSSFFVSCKQDNIIDKIFSSDEKHQIDEIVALVDSLVIVITKENSVEIAYHKYFELLVENEIERDKYLPDSAHISNIVSIVEKKKIFAEIWIKEYGYNYTTKELQSESLIINYKGKYMIFLEKLSKSAPFFKDYYKEINELSDIGPASRVWFVSNHLNYKFHDPDIRFMASVHLITVLYQKKL